MGRIERAGYLSHSLVERHEQIGGVLGCLEYLHQQTMAEIDRRDNTVVTIGDGILDVFIECEKPENEREGGMLINLDPKTAAFNLGGGANVTRGVSNFSRQVIMITGAGVHKHTDKFMELVNNLSRNVIPITLNLESTAVKTRYVSGGRVVFCTNEHSILDPETDAVNSSVVRNTLEAVCTTRLATIVVSDYGRGLVTPQLLSAIKDSNRSTQASLLIDPRPGQNDYMYDLPGAIIKPNRDETSKFIGIDLKGASTEDLVTFMPKIYSRLRSRFPAVDAFIPTFDECGAFYCSEDEITHVAPLLQPQEVVNPSGCGDIVASVFALTAASVGNELALKTGLTAASVAASDPHTSTLDQSLVVRVKSLLTRKYVTD